MEPARRRAQLALLPGRCGRWGHVALRRAARAGDHDLVGLPPAYVSTGEYDPLRDEGISYALRLLQAGVSVELHQYAGTFHGSTLVPAAVSRRQQAELLDALRRGLGLGSGPS